jgi:SAM-dependent methyltransferase
LTEREANSTVPAAVRWHDLECGGYAVDLPLWRELADVAGGPVLDCGAGTGRVALDLARRGIEVTALDVDGDLLGELERRAAAAGLAVPTVTADARELALEGTFALVLVPMQTVQLLGGVEGRLRFLARARAHLRPGGLVAAALADALEGYDADHAQPPLPDMGEWDGSVWSSRPVAVRAVPGGMEIERLRELVDPRGDRTVSEDRITLDTLDRGGLEREAIAAGLHPQPPRYVPGTEEYVGSVVVIASA